MSLLFCLGVKEGPLPVCFTVVFELEGISADQDLCRAYKSAQGLLVVFHLVQIHSIRRITGHDEHDRDKVLIAAGLLYSVGQILEDQSLVECSEGSCQIPEIIGGSDDQAVRLSYCIQNRHESVPADAMPFELVFLTSEAGNTSGILLQSEKIKLLK